MGSSLELKIPPPLVLAAMIGLVWGVSVWVPTATIAAPLEIRRPLALFCWFVGVITMLLGVIAIWRAATTVNPMTPARSSALVTSGVFSLSRNPIYLGDLLLIVGVIIDEANVLAAAAAPLFVAYISRFQIQPEEAALRRKFGTDYDSYVQRVRRWL